MGNIVVLGAGDFVYDIKSGDIGVLISRHLSRVPHRSSDFSLIVWRIYWCRDGDSRYTEESVINMILSEHLILYSSN